MGDMNVAHKDIDVGIKPENAKRWLKTGKSAFLPEERDWLQALLDWGLIDSYRVDNPKIAPIVGLTTAVEDMIRIQK